MLNCRVLVVDDEAIVRESICDWLKYSGFDVEIAENGEEALSMIGKHDFDIMVLDIRLPGESGMNVLAKARVIQPGIKSIMITAYPSEETAVEARNMGVLEYLMKPLLPDELERIIRETLLPLNKEGS
jgi:DNA-binding NtrC family response regulator